MLLFSKIRKLSNSYKNKSFEFCLSISLLFTVLEALSLTLIMPFFFFVSANSESKILIIKNFLEINGYIIYNFFITAMIIFAVIFLLRYVLSLILLLKLNNYTVNLQIFFSKNLLKYLINIDYIKFKNKNSTDFYTLVSKETEILSACSDHLIKIISEVFVVALILILLMYNNFYLTILIFSIIFLISLTLYFLLNKKIRFYGQQRRLADISRLLILKEIFVFFKELKIYNIENSVLDLYQIHNNKTQQAQKFRLFYSGFVRATSELIILFLFLFLFFLLINSKVYNEKYLGYIAFFVIGLVRMYPSFNKISSGIQFLQFHNKTVNYFYNLFKKKINFDLKSHKNEIKILSSRNKLILSNIDFKYPNGEKILRNLSAGFYQGEIIGIRGDSGKGKTTLCEIILSLIKPTNGSVKINNKSIFDNKNNWFKKISYVSQNSQVFYSDFYYNISLESNLTIEKKRKVEGIIKIVSPNLYKKFYNNFGKKLISDGKNLSGGEIQRLAICRALYKDSLVIIFDEFTNSLDRANERKILKVVKEISKDKIIIIVSHKEEVLSICDRVINLN